MINWGIRPSEAKQYPAFTVYPFYHESGCMPWAAAVTIHMDNLKDIILCGGHTGRDPENDKQPASIEEEKAGVGKVVGGIREQMVAAWTRIKESLEGAGGRLEDIVSVSLFIKRREDWYKAKLAMLEWQRENCPELIEKPRAGVLIRESELDLPGMLVEIEVLAAVPKRR